MNDKKPLVAHRQYGKDEDSTQALIKKQEAIELEIDGYSVKVAELETESQRMLKKEHFDSDTIRERQVTQHVQHHLNYCRSGNFHVKNSRGVKFHSFVQSVNFF